MGALDGVRAGVDPSTTPFQATSTALGVVETRTSFRRERNPKFVLCYSRSLIRGLLPEFLLCLGFCLKYFVHTIWSSLLAQMAKSLPAMQELQVRSLSQEDPLEKEMATHSSILAWEIPWTEEPGRPQSMRSQRVRHDWETNTYVLTHYLT